MARESEPTDHARRPSATVPAPPHCGKNTGAKAESVERTERLAWHAQRIQRELVELGIYCRATAGRSVKAHG
jgi:hypothetical protein